MWTFFGRANEKDAMSREMKEVSRACLCIMDFRRGSFGIFSFLIFIPNASLMYYRKREREREQRDDSLVITQFFDCNRKDYSINGIICDILSNLFKAFYMGCF